MNCFIFLTIKNAEDGIFKYLGDQLRNEPDLRCSETEQCMERVRKGSSAYVQVKINSIDTHIIPKMASFISQI